jgi:S1-C subfamily serine protease
MIAILAWLVLLCAAPALAEPEAPLVEGLPDFSRLAEAVVPTTVQIRVERGAADAAGLQQLRRDYQLPNRPKRAPYMGQTTGSGVIIDPEGIVLTNHHVVNGAQKILVTLHDKRVFAATVIGSDPRTDVAVLRMAVEGKLPAATIGDSDVLKVGQWVVAVGNPFDFQFTVTAGIVSARGRRGLARDEIQDYIQTDASVNPGSSGGPLFNLAGEVVGINTAIYSPDHERSQNAGISFAIPSKMARRIADELIQTGRVAYAGVGAATRDDPADKDDPRPGAAIVQIAPKGPAERAGLRRGDVIIAVDGEAVGSAADFRGIILAKGVNTQVRLRFERGSAVREARLRTVDEHKLGDWGRHEEAVEWGGASLVLADAARLASQGIALPEHKSPGLLVVKVKPGSPADTAGLAPGDVLLEIHRKPIESLDHLLGMVRNRNTALVGFWRGRGMHLAAVGGLKSK